MASDIIITQRLVLRSARASDLRPLQDLVFSAPEVMRLAFEGKSLSAEESAEFFAESFDHDGNGKQIGVLRLRAEETIIGFAGLLCCEVLGKRDYETGFVLGREFWGNGYATESAGHKSNTASKTQAASACWPWRRLTINPPLPY